MKQTMGLLLALVAACGVELGEPETGTIARPLTLPNQQMIIVAHEDDDFLFMNPDVQNQIRAGIPIVTVYITAGEAAGNGRCEDMFGSQDERAHDRQHAMRAVYAQMAHPTWTPEEAEAATWTRDLLVPDAGTTWPHTVERYTLPDTQIALIFMNLREDGDGNKYHPKDNPDGSPTIGHLFEDHSLTTDTVVPSCGLAGSCVHSPSCEPDVPWQNYDHDSLVAVLGRLLEMYQPLVVRTLDPVPLELTGSESNLCRSPGYYQDVCFDNLDHRYAGRFVDEVLESYEGANASRSTVVHYKGYSHTNYPPNIGQAAYLEKFAAGEAYRQARVLQVDGNLVQADPSYTDEAYQPDYKSMYERFPGSTLWLQRAASGSLAAVAVEGRRVKLWYERTPGGAWIGPVNLGGGVPISPHVTLLVRPDGRLQIFATRLPLGLEYEPPTGPAQEVVTAIQTTTNRIAFGNWRSVGAPDGGPTTGAVTAVFDGAGRAFVFARASTGVPAYSYAVGSRWAPWRPIASGVEDVLEGLAAIARDDGVVELFATSRTGHLQRYVQVAGTTEFEVSGPSVFDFDLAASAPTVTKNQDGRLQIFYREATDHTPGAAEYGRVRTAWVAPGGAWVGPEALYGDAGSGPIAAIRRGGTGEILIFQRNTWNGLSSTLQLSPNGAFLLQWNLRDGLLEEYPAAATDAAGRVVVIVKGSDGRLYIQREASPTAVGVFGPWILVGN